MKGKILRGLARTLRRKQTETEKRLWRHLRSRQFQGIKFRRQLPLGPYILDFCSLESKLVIELDGGQHTERQAGDADRTKFLEKEGFQVIRFWDNQIFENIEGVLENIRLHLGKPPSPRPSPLKGEGGGL
jgi:very-short-patch-repair endonuclease